MLQQEKAVVSDAVGVKVCPGWLWSFPELVEPPRDLQIHQSWEYFRYERTKQYSFALSHGIVVEGRDPALDPKSPHEVLNIGASHFTANSRA